MEVQGKITKILDKQTGTKKDGSGEWVKQSFTLETDEKYNNLYCFEVFGDEKVENLNKYNKVGDSVSVEFNVSTNSVREELNQLTKTELLTSQKSGRQVMYQANQSHPLFHELKSMVQQITEPFEDSELERMSCFEGVNASAEIMVPMNPVILPECLPGNEKGQLVRCNQKNSGLRRKLSAGCSWHE